MSAVMDQPQIELSEDVKLRLQEITLAAFHNLLIDTVANYKNQMYANLVSIAAIQQAATTRIVSDITTIESNELPE